MAKRSSLVLIALAMLFACAEPEDEIGPVFSNLNIDVNGIESETVDTIHVNEGDLIAIDITTFDDTRIAETKISVEAVYSEELHPEFASWNELLIQNQSSVEADISFISQIPTTSQGVFECNIEALDEFGNLGTISPFYFDVTSRLPVFEIDSVNGLIPTASFVVNASDTLLIKGEVNSTETITQLALNWTIDGVASSQQVIDVNASSFNLGSALFIVPEIEGAVELNVSASNGFGTRTCLINGSVSQ